MMKRILTAIAIVLLPAGVVLGDATIEGTSIEGVVVNNESSYTIQFDLTQRPRTSLSAYSSHAQSPALSELLCP